MKCQNTACAVEAYIHQGHISSLLNEITMQQYNEHYTVGSLTIHDSRHTDLWLSWWKLLVTGYD